jgi:hypothetical protein
MDEFRKIPSKHGTMDEPTGFFPAGKSSGARKAGD